MIDGEVKGGSRGGLRILLYHIPDARTKLFKRGIEAVSQSINEISSTAPPYRPAPDTDPAGWMTPDGVLLLCISASSTLTTTAARQKETSVSSTSVGVSYHSIPGMVELSWMFRSLPYPTRRGGKPDHALGGLESDLDNEIAFVETHDPLSFGLLGSNRLATVAMTR